MGYSDTLLNSSAEARIALEELTFASGSWSWSDWEGLKEKKDVLQFASAKQVSKANLPSILKHFLYHPIGHRCFHKVD